MDNQLWTRKLDRTVISQPQRFSCSEFDRLHSSGFIRGNYSCLGAKATNDTSPPTNNTTVPPDSPSSSLSTGAEAGIGAGVGAAAVGILGLLLWWFCFRKRKPGSKKEDNTPVDATAELPLGKHHEKTEVPTISKPGELHGHSFGEGFQYAVPRKPVAQTGQDELVGSEAERHELQ
ncbi:hypothetical protein DL98DRAFT_638517 [Cadophora sp. DSE1049]|nr:hypothetical protein DL98DRAFT_638517 [Cadophora sp. DSE1049]